MTVWQEPIVPQGSLNLHQDLHKWIQSMEMRVANSSLDQKQVELDIKDSIQKMLTEERENPIPDYVYGSLIYWMLKRDNKKRFNRLAYELVIQAYFRGTPLDLPLYEKVASNIELYNGNQPSYMFVIDLIVKEKFEPSTNNLLGKILEQYVGQCRATMEIAEELYLLDLIELENMKTPSELSNDSFEEEVSKIQNEWKNKKKQEKSSKADDNQTQSNKLKMDSSNIKNSYRTKNSSEQNSSHSQNSFNEIPKTTLNIVPPSMHLDGTDLPTYIIGDNNGENQTEYYSSNSRLGKLLNMEGMLENMIKDGNYMMIIPEVIEIKDKNGDLICTIEGSSITENEEEDETDSSQDLSTTEDED